MSASVRDRNCPHCGRERDERHFVYEPYYAKNLETGESEKHMAIYPCVFKFQEQRNYEEIVDEVE